MTNSTSTGVTAKRLALVFAWVGLALSLIAAAAVVRLFRSSSVGAGPYYFVGLPLTFAIVAVAASRGGSIGPMWTAIGAMAGAVIVFPGETREFDAPVTSIRFLAGFEVIGSWLFVAILVALLSAYSAGALWKRRAENRLFAMAGVATVMIGLVLIGSLAIGRAIAAAGAGRASGCESSGAKTTCWSQ